MPRSVSQLESYLSETQKSRLSTLKCDFVPSRSVKISQHVDDLLSFVDVALPSRPPPDAEGRHVE